MLDITTFLIFTLGILIITSLITRNDDHESSEGYFLAGRTLTGGVIAGSLMLTNLSTEQLVGLSGQAFSQGIHVMAWEVFAAFSMIIMALFFLPRYLQRGFATTPHFLEERFDTMTRSMVSFLFLAGYCFILLPVVLYSGALAVNSIFDVPQYFNGNTTTALWASVWGIGILGSIYAIWGGLRAVAISDTLNGIGLLIGGLAIPVLGLLKAGDGSMINGFLVIFRAHPEKFVSNGAGNASVPWHTLFTGMLLINLYYWCTNQVITQRALGAKNLKEGQKGVLFAAFLKILGPIIVVFPGVIAYHLYSTEIAGRPDEAFPTLVKHLMAPGFRGLFAGVLVGAILSSFNSALNSASTLFSLGFYKQYLKQGASDRQIVTAGKIFGTLLAIFSMTMAPALAKYDSIFQYLQKMNGLYNVPVITVFIVGFATKRISAAAAKFAIVFGSLFYGVSAFAREFSGLFSTGGEAHGFFLRMAQIHFLHHFAFACLLSGAIMFLFPRSDNDYTPTNSGHVEMTPWGKTGLVSFGVAVCAITLYVVTWDSARPAGPDAARHFEKSNAVTASYSPAGEAIKTESNAETSDTL